MIKTIFKLPTWCFGMIALPGAFTIATMMGTFQVETQWRYETPGAIVLLTFATGLLCLYGIVQLFVTYVSMVEIQSKVNKWTKVIDAYKTQLAFLKKDAEAIVTDTQDELNSVVGTSIPRGALITQIGEIRSHIAEAETTIAKSEVDLEEWLLGPLRHQAAYFYNVVRARDITVTVKRNDFGDVIIEEV